MPAFLEPDQFEPWQLDPDNQDSDELLSLIRTYPADRMAMHPVGSWVNKGVEGIRCVEKVERVSRAVYRGPMARWVRWRSRPNPASIKRTPACGSGRFKAAVSSADRSPDSWSKWF